jgi:negative regulator of sigma E activity
MTNPRGRSTQAMNERQPHHDEPSVDPAMESLLDAYARRLAHRPGLVDRVIAAAPMPVPRAASPVAPWNDRRIARMALAASVCAAMVVGMLFMRPAPSAAIAASPSIEAEPVLVSLLAGSDEAMLDDHPFGSELRTMDSDWSGLADEVRDIVAVAGGQR